MRLSLTTALGIVMGGFLLLSSAHSAELDVDSQELANLPADKQAALVEEMKKKGLLASGDSVKNEAEAEKSEEGERRGIPAIFIALVPKACQMIAAAKKKEEMAKCEAMEDEAKKGACVTSVNSQFGTVELVCGAIKLF